MSGERSVELDTALVKLARVLDVDAADVECFAHLDVDDLRAAHWHVVDVLGASDRRRLQGVVGASKLVPTGLAAKIGEKWFGPVLCARLVDLVEPSRAGSFAKHLSAEFMADITARTDPRGVGALTEHLEPATMQAIARVLVERDDHLTLSHFVGHLPAEVIVRILEGIDDHAAVVRIARYVDDLSHLDPIVALLGDERITALVRAVVADDLWVAGLHLFAHLGAEQVQRVASTIVNQDRAVVRDALDGIARHDLWAPGLELVERLDERDLVLFAEALLELDDAAVLEVVDVVDDLDAWGTLVRIGRVADDLDDEVRARLRTIVDQLPPQRLDRFRAGAEEAGHPGLLDEILGIS